MENNLLFAFFLSFLAGLSTAIGSFIAFVKGSKGGHFLSFSMGFSAGVMIYVSFMELLPNAQATTGKWITFFSFLGGIFLAAIIDRLIPEKQNPHEVREEKSIKNLKISLHEERKKLLRTGIFTAFAITIHNFPEGFATFATAFNDIKTGITIAFAVALHNIPEGISVSVPIYEATGNRKKSFLYSAISGFAEPLGALIGFLILFPFLSEMLISITLAVVAGIMIYISFDELLPTAIKYGDGHIQIAGIITGFVLIGISLNLF